MTVMQMRIQVMTSSFMIITVLCRLSEFIFEVRLLIYNYMCKVEMRILKHVIKIKDVSVRKGPDKYLVYLTSKTKSSTFEETCSFVV